MQDGIEARDIRSMAGINFLLGIWLIISPWILSYNTGGAKWNQFAFGIVILVLSGLRYIFPRALGASWLVALAGIWMIIAPFIIGYNSTAAYWNEVIVGIVVTILALSNMGTYGRTHGSPA
ncbi:MAG TPA: SPW repeat protein [Candidatus Saccharimonadales bacterium]|nr:SPW repeat protein [Candidatus Saccharimonadales bacterium]